MNRQFQAEVRHKLLNFFDDADLHYDCDGCEYLAHDSYPDQPDHWECLIQQTPTMLVKCQTVSDVLDSLNFEVRDWIRDPK